MIVISSATSILKDLSTVNLLFDPFLDHVSDGDEGPSLWIFQIFSLQKIFSYYY